MMSGFRSFNAAQSSFVEALLDTFREGGAARVAVIETAIRTAHDKTAAVEMRDEGEYIEGGDGVD